MPNTHLPLIEKDKEIQIVRKVFRAINHPLRKDILKLLEAKSQASVTEIYIDLNIEQSVASQHLKILKEAKAVEAKRVGKAIIYKPNYDKLSKLEKIVLK